MSDYIIGTSSTGKKIMPTNSIVEISRHYDCWWVLYMDTNAGLIHNEFNEIQVCDDLSVALEILRSSNDQ
jgi:hypothetical protein